MSDDPAVQAAIEARRVHEFADSGSSNCRCGWKYGDDGKTLDGHRLLVGIAAARPIIEADVLRRNGLISGSQFAAARAAVRTEPASHIHQPGLTGQCLVCGAVVRTEPDARG